MEAAFPEPGTGNEALVGKFARIQTRGKERPVSDFLHERGFLYEIQVVLEECILAMALFVSSTVGGILYGIQVVREDCILAMALFVSSMVGDIQDPH